MKNTATVMLIALVLAWATGANAAIIYDNGGPGTNAFVSDTDFPPTGQFVADDFSLLPGANVITGIEWMGLYAFNSTPPQCDPFTISIIADAGGLPAPGPLVGSVVVSCTGRLPTGITIGNSDLFAYSVIFVAPIPLPANTVFWLSIFNDTAADTDDNWFWSMTEAVGNSYERTSLVGPWSIHNNNRQDFRLLGPDVPEPSVLALFAIGVLGLLGQRRERAR